MWRFWSRRARQTPAGPSVPITVTEADIERGKGQDSDRNPVALALLRALDVANVHVGGGEVTIIRSWTPLDVDVIPLPPAVLFWLSDFEEGRRVRPMTFELVTDMRARPAEPAAKPSLLRLPAAEREIARRIQEKAEALLVRAGDFPVASRDIYVVRQTLDSYLPDTLNAYLALPDGWPERPITADGRTGRQVLQHALGLMEERLDAIDAEMTRRRAEILLVQDRFLEDRLGDPPP